jgi:trehalose/maltose hydrolase-like predicted phosphorylase
MFPGQMVTLPLWLAIGSFTARTVLARYEANTVEYPTRFDGVNWDNEQWILRTTNLDQGHYQSRMSLANGYLGINVAALGPFFEVDSPVADDQINGWPLFDRRQTFSTIAGFWDQQPTTNGTNYEWLNQYGGESVISGVPHWSGLVVQANGQTLNASTDASTIKEFSSWVDHKNGLMQWKYTWTAGGCELGVKYEMFVHKLYVNLAAVRLSLSSTNGPCNATVLDVFEGDGAQRTDFVDKGTDGNGTIYSAVRPNGINNVTAYIYSTLTGDGPVDLSTVQQVNNSAYLGANQSSIAQSVSLQLSKGEPAVITKFVGGASTDAFPDPQAVARNASIAGAQAGWEPMLQDHEDEWNTIFTPDSVDDYSMYGNGTLPDDYNILELQITAVVNPFHLLQNTVSANAITMAQATGNSTGSLDSNSIPVCGLGSECYAGLIFWDAEVWMAPGLVVAFPEAAKQIANYRVQRFGQAQANVKTAYQSSKNETGMFSEGGAVFSWTSGRSGNCTGTGPCFDYEYHLNGDIGLEFYNYYVASGDTDFFKSQLFPVYDAVAWFYAEALTYNSSVDKWSLTNATDPDEYANNVDLPGFTMVLMKTHLETANMFRSWFGMPINDTWTNRSNNIQVPVNEPAQIILEYSDMNGTVAVKQADVVLVDDFLDYPNPYSLSDLDYYAGKQSPNGPGMTYGVFSIVANEISPSGCSAYTYQLYGSQPYTRPPWFQFSEQLLDDFTANGGTHPAYPFLTGEGGANRVAPFGYLGLRLMVDSLNVDPNLPPQIPHLNYRTIYWQGHAINATSNQTHTTLQRLGKSMANANSTYANSPIPVTIGVNKTDPMSLPINGSLVIKNRQIGNIATVPGNVAQCRPASSPQEYLPGQFPLSAVDGATSTKWQPIASNVSSYITVELDTPYVPISGFYFDWAQNPPTSYSVTFCNSSNFRPQDIVNVTSDSTVSISGAFNATAAIQITAYMSNTTNVTLDQPIWSGNYARLTIQGNQATTLTNSSGATVAEWGILGPTGGNVPARLAKR